MLKKVWSYTVDFCERDRNLFIFGKFSLPMVFFSLL